MTKLINFLSAKKYQESVEKKGPVPQGRQIVSRVFDIALPSTVEAVFVSLISAVDTIMVGGLGASAIAAVGVTNQPRMILLAPIIALNVGVTIIVSRRKGQNRRNDANLTLRNSIIISLLLASILNLGGLIFAERFLSFAGATSDYIATSVDYFRIICIGNLFNSVSLTMTAAQRGAGNTKISMRTNIAANLVNIVTNYLLINGIWVFPRLEVVGAGIATALGNVVGLVIAIYSLTNKDLFLFVNFKSSWKLDIQLLRTILKISWPTMIEQIFLRIGFFTFAMMVAGLGTKPFATHQIAMSIMSITFSLGNGLQIASTSLVGQSLGAKRPDMALIYGKSIQHFGRLIAIGIGLLIVLFREPIMELYSKDFEIISYGSNLLIILAVIIFFQVGQVITVGSLRGAGDVRFAAFLSMISIMILRPILTYSLAYLLGLGLIGAWIAVFVDQIIRWLASHFRYQSKKWLNHVI